MKVITIALVFTLPGCILHGEGSSQQVGQGTTSVGTSGGGVPEDPSAPSGSSAGGASSGDSAPMVPPDPIPPPVVGDCSSLAAPGTWEPINPPGFVLDRNYATPAGTNYGTGSFVLDPVNVGTGYFGTSAQGIYKTTDCGANWKHVNTGVAAGCESDGVTVNCLDRGRQWAMQIDPTDSQVLYTNSGYGQLNGMWKSTDGGVNFEQKLPPCIMQAFSSAGGFLARISMSPTNHKHLVVTPHFSCVNVAASATCSAQTHSDSCVFESTDAGDNWHVIENAPAATEGAGLSMVTDQIWLWQAPAGGPGAPGGLWRTTNGGGTWAQAPVGATSDAFYAAADGTLYVGASTLLTSTDQGANWASVKNSPTPTALTGDGTTIYSSYSYCTGASQTGYQPYSTASESDLSSWTKLASPPMFVGGREIKYDAAHHLLYSGNCNEGFWRVVTE